MFDALFDVKIDNLVRLAVEAPRVQEPGPAFRGFLLGVIEARATDRGLGVVVMRTGRGKGPPRRWVNGLLRWSSG